MGLLGRLRSAGAGTDHDVLRLRGTTDVEGVVPIGTAQPRVPVRICGEIRQIRLVPHEYSKVFEVTVTDGTGEAVLAFNGNRRIAGLDPGRRVLAEGVGRPDRRRIRLLNPAYTLLD